MNWHCHFNTIRWEQAIWMETWKLFRFWCGNSTEWVKDLSCHEHFMLLRQEIFLPWNDIKTAIYTSIIHEDPGRVLSWHLWWENFLTRNTLSKFHCISQQINRLSFITQCDADIINGQPLIQIPTNTITIT